MLSVVNTSISIHEGQVDITSESVVTANHAKRRRRSVEEKPRIVEETLEAGASVARIKLAKGMLHVVGVAVVVFREAVYNSGQTGTGKQLFSEPFGRWSRTFF
jgi:hypothetical protein